MNATDTAGVTPRAGEGSEGEGLPVVVGGPREWWALVVAAEGLCETVSRLDADTTEGAPIWEWDPGEVDAAVRDCVAARDLVLAAIDTVTGYGPDSVAPDRARPGPEAGMSARAAPRSGSPPPRAVRGQGSAAATGSPAGSSTHHALAGDTSGRTPILDDRQR